VAGKQRVRLLNFLAYVLFVPSIETNLTLQFTAQERVVDSADTEFYFQKR
jgi:hypothetical protein